jgi:hypothetical protein
MEETSSTAVVEPKQKSQEPAAKARRLKRLRTNPDFAEAVSEERARPQNSGKTNMIISTASTWS